MSRRQRRSFRGRGVAAATIAILLGVCFVPPPAAAEIDIGGFAAYETDKRNGEKRWWYGGLVSWWPEFPLGVDLDVRVGRDRGEPVTQPLPWLVLHRVRGAFRPYFGAAPAIVEEDGKLVFRDDSLYLKAGVRIPAWRFLFFVQAVGLVGELAEGTPVGAEAGIAWRFGDIGE